MSDAPEASPEGQAAGPVTPPPATPREPRLVRLLRWMDTLLAFLLAVWKHTWAWAAGMLLIGLSPGLLLWPLVGSGDLNLYLDNAKLSLDVRMQAMQIVLLGLLAVLVPYGVVAGLAFKRARRDTLPGLEAVACSLARVNDWLWFALVLPCVPVLCVPKIETAHPWIVLLDCLVMGAVAVVAAYRLPIRRRGPPTPDRPVGNAWAPWAVTLAAMLTYGVVLTWFSIRQHHALGTAVFDLGVYDNLFWQSSHGRFLAVSFIKGGTHASAHVDPLLVLLSPLHLLYPHAETLLILQAFWVASAAIPAFLIARLHLGSAWQAAVIPICLMIYPALQGANLYDFHSLTLATPTILWCLYLLERRHWKRYAAALGILLLTREDMSLLACFIGLHAIVSRHAPRAGLLTIAVALVYFVIVKLLVMPDSGVFMNDPRNAYNYASYYTDMIPDAKEGARGLLTTFISHPFFTVKHAMSEPKLLFFLTLFVPLLFLPFVAPKGRVMLVYGFMFLFTATRPAVFSTAFQYPIVLFVMAFALTPVALARLREAPLVRHFGLDAGRLVPALLCGMLVSGLGVSAKYGAVLPNDAFRGGFNRLNRELDEHQEARYAAVQRMVEKIGPDDSVTATTRLGPHISGRRKAHLFPDGLGNDWLLVEPRALDADDKARLKGLRDAKAYLTEEESEGIALLRRDPAVAIPAFKAGAPAAATPPSHRTPPPPAKKNE